MIIQWLDLVRPGYRFSGEFRDVDGLKICSKNFRLARYIKPVGIFLIVSSVILLIGAGFAYWSSKSFVDQAVKTKGKVIHLRESVSDGNTYYYPSYTFTDSSGVKHTIHASSGSNPPSYSFFSLWGLPTILSVLGGVYLIFGIFLNMLGRYVNTEEGEQIA